MCGLARPSTEVVWANLEPRGWVLGFLFGFAWSCAALLSAVYVRLHLVLFSGWQAFSSVSLCKNITVDACSRPMDERYTSAARQCLSTSRPANHCRGHGTCDTAKPIAAARCGHL
jgi:hypothetical protein